MSWFLFAVIPLALADDDNPWGATTPSPAPGPASSADDPWATPAAPAPAAVVALAPVTPKPPRKGICGALDASPTYRNVSLAGGASLQGSLASSDSASGGGGVGLQFGLDCFQAAIAIGVGNQVQVTGQSAEDFGAAVLGMTADSAVLSYRSRFRLGGGPTATQGFGLDLDAFASSSTWTAGDTSAHVWLLVGDVGLDYVFAPDVQAPGDPPQDLDLRFTVEAGAILRLVVDDPTNHLAATVLASDEATAFGVGGAYLRPRLRVGNFEPFVEFAYEGNSTAPDALSGLRVVAGTRVDGALLRLPTKSEAAAARTRELERAAAFTEGVMPEEAPAPAPTAGLL